MPAERSDRIEELYHAARQREPEPTTAFPLRDHSSMFQEASRDAEPDWYGLTATEPSNHLALQTVTTMSFEFLPTGSG